MQVSLWLSKQTYNTSIENTFPLSSPGEKACYWLYLYWYNPQALYCKYSVCLNLSNSIWNNVADWLANMWLVGHNLLQLSVNPYPPNLLCKLFPSAFWFLYFSSWRVLSRSRKGFFSCRAWISLLCRTERDFQLCIIPAEHRHALF